MVKYQQLSMKGLALGVGAMWGISMLFFGWVAMTGYGANFVAAIGSVYLGYKATFFGAIIGGLYGFVDGAIGGMIIAWVYNWTSKK